MQKEIKTALEEMDLGEIYAEPSQAKEPIRTIDALTIKAIASDLKDYADGYLALSRIHGVRRGDVYLIDCERKAEINRRLNPEPIKEPDDGELIK